MDSSELLNQVIKSGNFSFVDWVIVSIYLLASLAIGLYANKFVGGLSDYVVAGRKLGTALSIATVTGTELGLITVMYSAQKGFNGGFAAFHIALIAGIVTFLVGWSGFLMARLRETKAMTIPEYYEIRFGRKVRVLGGILLAAGGVLNMGIFLQVGAKFIVGATGLDPQGNTLIFVMIILLGLVLTYTILGGMISVVITDYIQFVVLSFGLVLTVGLVLMTQSFDQMVDVVSSSKGEAGFNPVVADSGFGSTYMVWQAVLGLVSCAIWPTAVSRALSCRDAGVVRRQYMFSSISFMIRFMIPYFLGIGAFVYFTTQGGILADAFIVTNEDGETAVNSLYALPVFLSHILPIGLLGLIVAAMIAAFMSTHDSYLLCWSSVITLDVIAPLRGETMTEKAKILSMRIIIVIIGLYILFWGLFYEPSDDLWDYLGISGAIYFTGAISVLTFGLYWKRASSTGAALALLSGFVAILGLGKFRSALFPEWIGPAEFGLMSLALSFLCMIVGSILVPDPPSDTQAPLAA